MTYRLSQLRTLLKENHLFPKKRLSQTFIVDGNIVRKVVDEAAISPGERVLEIGPGPGALTEALLSRGARVIAVEKDPAYARLLGRVGNLAPISRQISDNSHTPSPHFSSRQGGAVLHEHSSHPAGRQSAATRERFVQKSGEKWGLEIFEGDIRDFPLEKAVNAKIVANLPFNITTRILPILIPRLDLFSSATFIVQEEVARRIVATPGDPHYSSLSLFVRYYTTPTYAFPISRRSFYPVPGVDSAVVKLTLKKPPEIDSPEHFFTLARTAFKQRRKMVRSSLKALYPACNSDKRPEELSLEDFVELYNSLTFRI